MKIISIIIVCCFTFLEVALAQYDAGNNGRKLDWALFYLENHYVDSTDSEYLAEVALKAIVKELDPYSRYQTLEEAKRQSNRDKGIREEGIGLRFYLLNDTAIVTSITEGSSADLAGINLGDQILAVDGGSIIDFSWNNVNALLKGKKGTEVYLDILRNRSEQLKYQIERKGVPYHSLAAGYMLDEETAYIKFQSFNSRTIPEFEKFTATYKPKNFVIDLRDNRGGVLKSAIDLANHFLVKDQLIVYSSGFNLERKNYFADGEGKFQKAKVVVLVDKNTMSASETFTAALQDYDRCLIIGTNTFGKGLIQQSYKLGDGSTLRITIGKYFSPKGREIQKHHDVKTDWLTANENIIPDMGFTSTMDVPDKYHFKTFGNRRIISGHGGIAPDVYMKGSSEKDEYYEMLNDEGLVFGFVTWYIHENRRRLTKLFPSINMLIASDGLTAEIDYAFTKYLERKNKEWELNLALKPIPTTPRTMKQIKSWIGTQLWGANAYYQAHSKEDKLIKRAGTIISSNEFNSLGIN